MIWPISLIAQLPITYAGNIPAYLKTNLKIRNNGKRQIYKIPLGPTFVPPNSKLKTVGDRSYPVGVPKLWNELPLNLRCVKSLNSFKTT